MLIASVLFISALAPDTATAIVYQRLDPAPRVTMAVAAVPAPPWVRAGADTADFRRDNGSDRDPLDVAVGVGTSLQVAVRVDGRPWSTCGVYLGATLIGWFRRAPEQGSERRPGGAEIEDGARK